jgi:chromosome segregation ATPase
MADLEDKLTAAQSDYNELKKELEKKTNEVASLRIQLSEVTQKYTSAEKRANAYKTPVIDTTPKTTLPQASEERAAESSSGLAEEQDPASDPGAIIDWLIKKQSK